MNYFFHPAAKSEFLDAVEYYEGCEEGLGYDFSAEIYSAIQTILRYPKAWPILTDDVHRFLTNRFPFGVLYVMEEDHILIIAIMHLHRSPGYWSERH